jgi:hypothetical protein
MGIEDYDLTPFIAAMSQTIQELMPGVSCSGSGTMDLYLLYKITDETTTQYVLFAEEGINVIMDLTYSGSYQGQEFSTSMCMVIAGTVEGTLNVNKSDLSIASGSFALDIDMTMSGSTGWLGAYAGTIKVSGSANMSFNPALDLFDFPISVGENWNVQSTMTMAGTMTLTMNLPLIGEQTMNIPLISTTQISLIATCPGTARIQTAEGETTDVYKIVYSGTTGNPFFPGGILYYSPEERFIVGQEANFSSALTGAMGGIKEQYSAYTVGLFETDDQTLFMMAPMMEEEVIDAIASIGQAEINFLPVAAAILVVVGIIAGAVIVLKRR